ncbi:hypothetical protein Tco_1046246 [Tanacetum coccineum]
MERGFWKRLPAQVCHKLLKSYSGESQMDPIKEEEEKAARVAALTQTKMILSQNGVGCVETLNQVVDSVMACLLELISWTIQRKQYRNSHCLAQVYEITVVAGITKTSNVHEHYLEL